MISKVNIAAYHFKILLTDFKVAFQQVRLRLILFDIRQITSCKILVHFVANRQVGFRNIDHDPYFFGKKTLSHSLKQSFFVVEKSIQVGRGHACSRGQICHGDVYGAALADQIVYHLKQRISSGFNISMGAGHISSCITCA